MNGDTQSVYKDTCIRNAHCILCLTEKVNISENTTIFRTLNNVNSVSVLMWRVVILIWLQTTQWSIWRMCAPVAKTIPIAHSHETVTNNYGHGANSMTTTQFNYEIHI